MRDETARRNLAREKDWPRLRTMQLSVNWGLAAPSREMPPVALHCTYYVVPPCFCRACGCPLTESTLGTYILFLRLLPASDDVEEPVEQLQGRSDVLDLRVLSERLFVKRLLAVNPLNLIDQIGQSFLDAAHVAGVLRHHVGLEVIVKVVAALTNLTQLGRHFHFL